MALLRGCDGLTEALLYFMIVFSPWAFGTTQDWAISVMNACGYALGVLWLLHRAFRAPLALPILNGSVRTAQGATHWTTRAMAALTVLLLAYTLVSAWNARATFVRADFRFDYHNCIRWLPHSMDSTATWQAFRNYLALALVFWATRDWLLRGAPAAEAANAMPHRLPRRLRRLLWVLSVNGALLALEGVLQRISGTNRLLWLVQPRINSMAEAQFGPYAYRSNGAQYLALLWPVTLGLWSVCQRAAARASGSRTRQHLLIPCVIIMVAGPLVSLSRAGAILTLASVLVAILILWQSSRVSAHRSHAGLILLLATSLLVGGYAVWPQLSKRINAAAREFQEGRFDVWKRAWQMHENYPLFGTGPKTFEPVYQFYSPQIKVGDWPAQLHNDWLETLITFGWLGFLMILALLLLAAGRWFFGGGIPASPVFTRFLWLGLGSCLAHGAVDFPFQIYSILFLFILLCAVLSCLGRSQRA